MYLLAGYKNGTLVLWDCSKFRMAHIMTDVARDESSAFLSVKVLYLSSRNGGFPALAVEESGRTRVV